MKKTIQLIITSLLLFCCLQSNAQTAAGYKLPAYQKFKLPSGLTVYLMEKHTVPVMSINVLLPAGAVYDEGKAGIAYLTSRSLTSGTKNYTKRQIDEQVDFAGASLDATCISEYALVNAKFAVKDKDKLLPVIKDILLNATFPDSEFVKIKKQELSNIEQAKESPGAVIGDYWNKFMYGSHVYGNVVQGTATSVTALSANDAKTFYNQHYNPAHAVVAVVGDFDNKTMKATITKLLADWKGNSNAPITDIAASLPTTSKANVLLVNKADAKETTFYIGGMGINRSNPDYLAVQVVNTLFGGRFTSLLNQELRVKTGLTYGARSYFNYNKNAGTFSIGTHTANETTKAAIDTALAVMKHLHTVPLDAAMLTSAKNYMIGLFPPRYQTTDQLAGLLTNMFWYGYDEAYINNFEKNVNAVTLEKANEIITKYFPADNLRFVLIGKAAEIKKIAEAYGTVTEVDIKEDIGKGL